MQIKKVTVYRVRYGGVGPFSRNVTGPNGGRRGRLLRESERRPRL